MKEALNDFGTISLAVKDTTVYSEDSVNFGTLDANYRKSFHNNAGGDKFIVFEPNADFAAIDGIIPLVQDSANGSDWTTIVTGSEVTAPKVGQKIRLPYPAKHRLHMRAGATPKSSGTFTAKTVESYVEFGPETE